MGTRAVRPRGFLWGHRHVVASQKCVLGLLHPQLQEVQGFETGLASLVLSCWLQAAPGQSAWGHL